jgi:hypothetical protein
MNWSSSKFNQLFIYWHMIVRSSELFRDCAKISDQEFQFFSSMRISSIDFLIVQWVENFQVSFDLLSSNKDHAINYLNMNRTFRIMISIIFNACHMRNFHIKQNFNEDFNFKRCDVRSWSLLMSDFNFFQIDFNISIICHYFKKSKAEEELK